MRKGLAATQILENLCPVLASLNLPLKPVTFSAVCAFICHCMDMRDCKPPYIKGLVVGILFNARCFDPTFPSLFSNPAIRLLFKGISKVSPSSPDNRLPITLSILHRMLSILRLG